MGDLVITAEFEGGDEFAAALDFALDPGNWIIHKRADCCPLCRANEDPFIAGDLHPHDRCWAEFLP